MNYYHNTNLLSKKTKKPVPDNNLQNQGIDDSNTIISTTTATLTTPTTTEVVESADPAEKYSKTSSKVSSAIMKLLFSLQNMTSTFVSMVLPSWWKGGKDFVMAQVQVVIILVIAYIGNNWKYSYPRNDNHNPAMFWVMNIALLVAGALTWKHDIKESARGVQLLSRSQTEEWKGWMQWAFIMYHYYRMYAVYNEIRVFVSAYVWMTGFGNFLYFDKTKDFSLERAVSMWIRINYFPLMLSVFINVPLELYYVVPLHTAGFFIAMATCFFSTEILQTRLGYYKNNRHHANAVAIAVCLLVHVLFYETPAVNFLKWFSDEYFFRFQADKYSAWVGILSGFVWYKLKDFMQWCYNSPPDSSDHSTYTAVDNNANGESQEGGNASSLAIKEVTLLRSKLPLHRQKDVAMWGQRLGGVFLIFLWYALFGHLTDKYSYNPVHPYVFWMPMAGWLMLRNSSKYLTEAHAGVMEFFGRITLETYVLQFHVFMCNKVQHIPIVIPGSGPDGLAIIKVMNMLLCGTGFVALAYWARQITITTQTALTELVGLVWRGTPVEDHAGGDGCKQSSAGDGERASSTTTTESLSENSRDAAESKESV